MSYHNAPITQVTKQSIELSIVVPMYNEAANLSPFFERLFNVLNRLHIAYEIVCANDGSQDNTLTKLLKYQKHNPFVKIVDLSRHFGKEIELKPY
jgi:glycosyltransferase involved in cell wall biosynthesis